MIAPRPSLLGAAAVLAGLSVFAFGWLAWRLENSRREMNLERVLGETTATPRTFDSGEDGPSVWSSPSNAAEGCFELFTPPDLLFDPHAKTFAVRDFAEDAAARKDDEAGVEFIENVPQPYRIRLFGHQGGPGAWRGCFIDDETGEMANVGVGQVPALRIEVLRLDVGAAESGAADTIQSRKRVVATVRDLESGREIALGEGEGGVREEIDVRSTEESR